MSKIQSFLSLLLILTLMSPNPSESVPSATRTASKLSKPLVGDDGRIYACSHKTLFAFENNGSIAWSFDLDFSCNINIAPVKSLLGKIYLVAENRVLKVDFQKVTTPEDASTPVLFPQQNQTEILGLAVITYGTTVIIIVTNKTLSAYGAISEKNLWSVGPNPDELEYRRSCRRSDRDCFFASVPVIDQCQASIYVSNTQGELYSFSTRSPHLNWIKDLSSFDKVFTVTPGGNDCLYVTIPVKAVVLALDTFSGNVLWQKSIGPLSTADYAPVVDSNGWISIGSLDGLLYSISPTGILNTFSKSSSLDSVIQVSPVLDCSGYAVYMSQTEMDGKITNTIGEYTYVSAMKPKNSVLTLLAPATGSIYWSESYPGEFSALLSKSDLQRFVLDETLLLAFVTAAKIGNPLQCRTRGEKFASLCSRASTKRAGIYTGNEWSVLLFLLFQSLLMLLLFALVRFCCIFWRKEKLQGQDLGSFLEKRRSLQMKKKSFDRTIAELEQKAAQEAAANKFVEEISNLVRERNDIERQLLTTYSLGRDGAGLHPKSVLPLYDVKTRSYSLPGARKERVTIFHTVSDTSSSSERETSRNSEDEKGKAPIEEMSRSSSSDDEIIEKEYKRSPSKPETSSSSSSSSGFIKLHDEGKASKSMPRSIRSMSLMRRRTLSSTN